MSSPGIKVMKACRLRHPRTAAQTMLLTGFLLAVGFCSLFLLAPSQARAQLEAAFKEEPEELPRFTLEETQTILVANRIEEEVAKEYLGRFDEERTFTEAEIEIIYRLIRPEERPLVPGEEAVPEIKDMPIFAEEVLPKGYEEPLLKPFGYSLFRTGPLRPTPPEDVSVGPDYVVGVGDEILITIWGDVEKRYAKVIDRQGRLILPDVGIVTVAGKTLGELREELEALFGQVYKSFRMTTSLGDVRTIQVYVSGDVCMPGSYTLSALSTAFTALYFAGGPTFKGSLRSISLSRRGREKREIDLYSFLLTGDRELDILVQSGDIVHVHPLGPTVKVIGEVRRPAIYEIREGESLRDVIRMAGGMTAMAFTKAITVDRLSETAGNQVHKFDWADSLQNLTLKGGDEVSIFSIHQAHPKEFVEIHGIVQHPGIYRLVPGMKIADLIFRAGGTQEGAFLQRAELARSIETGLDSLAETQLIGFPLRAVLGDPDNKENLVLRRGDKVFVRAAPGWHPPPVVALEGQVEFPGKYGLESLTEKISDLIDRAGGLTPQAFPRGAQVFRRDEGRVIIDFSKVLKDPRSSDNIALEDGDSVYVPRRPETVRVSGAVATPGLLIYTSGKKAKYYIDKTGGLAEKADKGRVRIIRVTGASESAKRRFWPDPRIEVGDEIFVAEMEEKKPIDWSKTLRDATAIIAGLATTVYVIMNIQ